jgi:hypothetical protein
LLTPKNVPDSQDVSSPASSENSFWISVCQRRPYFHITKLNVVKLDKWHRHVDFEEGQGDFERTAFLYERCLVTCALYDKFWLRYARWMFSQGKEENAHIIDIEKGVDGVFMSLFLPVSKTTDAQQMSLFCLPGGHFLDLCLSVYIERTISVLYVCFSASSTSLEYIFWIPFW